MKKRNTTLVASIILLTVISIVTIGVSGAEVTNIDTGEIILGLQNAINDDDTKDGHTLVISSGEYWGNIIISKSITLRAEKKGEVKVKAKGPIIAVIKANADNVTISGLNIDGRHKELSNRCRMDAIGISVWGDSNCEIDNCTFTRTTKGIELGYADNITIRDNLLIYTYGDGITLQKASNCTIETTNISAFPGCGIRINRGRNNLFQKNYIKNNLHGIIAFNSENTTIQRNNITENRANGLAIYNSTDTTITANEITQNRANGILINNGTCRINTNTIIGNSAKAIATSGKVDALIKNNTCASNGVDNCEG